MLEELREFVTVELEGMREGMDAELEYTQAELEHVRATAAAELDAMRVRRRVLRCNRLLGPNVRGLARPQLGGAGAAAEGGCFSRARPRERWLSQLRLPVA